ncbi:MAG: UDP-4-amino-4,6-dideoxy-N-acetyl-beta-L-altrosamine transaminase [Candidatus Omnitrophica bacterium]|nr:UDP-4-amino-4,6-dideoxy-N-acetyl-beta-L-altrosamine transaminase [Candidatus Omnitrophota bacterium]MBU1997386.1 UDP-4-amino-4,6-dideoxy-N-acetyl-beta-L-altrosamine transaminase [Candidatus Omnitrophota bacterium]MBU4334638.1 UDP-4-amino-4,6-dideoxy-N-acetyl-beta-L-altrosamine transaminase [Candidatus Omnitrophota bacterium]
MKKYPYCHQTINAKDINAVKKALQADFVTQGPIVRSFEIKLAKYCGAKYAVAVSSGTAALHLACLAAGLKKGAEAITSPITFLSTSNAVIYVGAKPVFADIDAATINIDPNNIKKAVNKRTKAILPVHFAGLPCDMKSISAIAKKHKLTVIEDAAHALGAKYLANGKIIKIGSCYHSDMTTFSFHPAKHITTGEGGAITTNSDKLYKQLIALRAHGMYKDKATQKIGPWFYEMRELGFNYRVTDFQCALGISQLSKLNGFIAKRRALVRNYNKLFKNIDFIDLVPEPKGFVNSYHLYILKINYSKFKTTRNDFMKSLMKKGIQTQVNYIPVYLQPYYKNQFKYKASDFPCSQKHYNECVSIPLYPELTFNDQEQIASIILKTLKK